MNRDRLESHLCRLIAGPAEEPALLNAWLVRDRQDTPANIAPDEHDGIEWFDLEELPPPAHVPLRTAPPGGQEHLGSGHAAQRRERGHLRSSS
jgi:hypothetical protein